MLASQLHNGGSVDPPPEAAVCGEGNHGLRADAWGRSRGNMSKHPSDHTKIWSNLSGSAAKSNNGKDDRQAHRERNQTVEQREVHRIGALHISRDGAPVDAHGDLNDCSLMERNQMEESQGGRAIHGQASQHHTSNWVDADEDDDEGDEQNCVSSQHLHAMKNDANITVSFNSCKQ